MIGVLNRLLPHVIPVDLSLAHAHWILNLDVHKELLSLEGMVEEATRMLTKQTDNPPGSLLADELLELFYKLVGAARPFDYLDTG
ncbi:MAG: hypothetical protein LM580_09390 [Thermofilum sp.]|nr:hypothetical protein [Thermofilum sp.]